MRYCIQITILILILLCTIAIIIWCLLSPKKYIRESLLVSPVKLYSSRNKMTNEICEIDNYNQNKNEEPRVISESESEIKVYGYADYITISDYLRIKNQNPLYRPGRELIGKKVRILLPKFTRETIPDNIVSEDSNYCGFEPDTPPDTYETTLEEENSREIPRCPSSRNRETSLSSSSSGDDNYDVDSLIDLNKSSSCYVSSNDYSSLETESPDKTFAFSDYFKCENNECWYDVNIINYSFTNYPCSMHKISWKNELDVIEYKWINLFDYQIEVPVEPHNMYFKNEIQNKNYGGSYYFWKTNIEDGTSILDEENQSDSCSEPLKKKYYGQISCSKNEDCHKYGTLYCNGGTCETKYIQL